MDFAQQQRNPARHLPGITFVVVLHLVVGYALVTGLARKVVDVIKQPIETKIIEEIKKPPPDTPPPPPPKLAAPPPPFIPPPEIQIQMPVQMQQTAITAVTTVKPPPAPLQVTPPKPAPSTAVGVACPNSGQVRTEIEYPKEALKNGISGEVTIEFTVDRNGAIKDAQVLRSSNRLFDRVSISTVAKFRCVGQGQEVRVQVPFEFKIN